MNVLRSRWTPDRSEMVVAESAMVVAKVEENPAGSQFARPLAILVDEHNRLHSGLTPHYIAEARGL